MDEREPLCQITGFHAKPHSGMCPECGDRFNVATGARIRRPLPTCCATAVAAATADMRAECDRLRAALHSIRGAADEAEGDLTVHAFGVRAAIDEATRPGSAYHARAVLAVTAPTAQPAMRTEDDMTPPTADELREWQRECQDYALDDEPDANYRAQAPINACDAVRLIAHIADLEARCDRAGEIAALQIDLADEERRKTDRALAENARLEARVAELERALGNAVAYTKYQAAAVDLPVTTTQEAGDVIKRAIESFHAAQGDVGAEIEHARKGTP